MYDIIYSPDAKLDLAKLKKNEPANFNKAVKLFNSVDIYIIFTNLIARMSLTNRMTAIQLNAEIYRTMSVIAEDEGLLKQALKYLKKLATKRQDETLMTKEEFFARVDRAKQGKAVAMLPNENLTEFLRRQGYDL